jgi:nucleoid-associated protein YgaU
MDTFSRSYSYTYTDYNAISQGQFSRPSGVDLASVTFQTLFVDFDAPWSNLRGTPEAQNASLDPQQMTQQLLKILRRGTPFELIVGQRALWNSNDVHWGPANGNAATLRTLDIEERAGEIDARYVNVGFTEFRTAELVRKGLGDGDGKNRDPKRGRDLPTSVVVKVSDNTTLTDLAKKYYGSTAEWRSIAKRNGISWQQNRSLGDWVKSQGDKQRTIVIPEIETLKTLGTFLAGKAGAAAAA